MYCKNLTILAGVTTAIAAGMFVLFGPETVYRSRKKSRGLCPGLINTGNTCFLNAILQSFAACHSVLKWLTKLLDREKCSKSLTLSVAETLRVLNNQCDDVDGSVCPTDILECLRHKQWIITADEQDSHELFHVMTESLEEEMSLYPGLVSLLDINGLQMTTSDSQLNDGAITKVKTALHILPKNTLPHPFRGLLASQLQCKDCGFKFPVRHDNFDSLSLSIPSSCWKPLTLDRLLQHFIRSETVHNVECLKCSTEKADISSSRSTCLKKLTVAKLPQCLCFHIQRTVWLDNGIPTKKRDYVEFSEHMDMSSYIYKGNQSRTNLSKMYFLPGGQKDWKNSQSNSMVNLKLSLPLINNIQPTDNLTTSVNVTLQEQANYQIKCHYRLMAVIVHLGDIFSGHFVTYRRAVLSGPTVSSSWLYCSDELVKTSTLTEVLDANAYMLFYEKM